MLILSENWLSEGLLDVEYKQYELLSYLSKVEIKFDELELYPYFSDILAHYEALILYRNNKLNLKTMFPKELIDISLENTQLIYKDLITDEDYLVDIDTIVEFAIPKFRKTIGYGKFLKDEVEQCMDIIQLDSGMIQSSFGHFIIPDKNIEVYEYELGLYRSNNNSRILKTKLVRSYPRDLFISYESIRADLYANDKHSHTVFLVESPIDYPLESTLLPMAKRLLFKKLSYVEYS